MNWLASLLAVYLLGLSLWPCADVALSIEGQASGCLSVIAAASHGGAAHEEHDQCTPFCTCTCCAVTITVVSRFSYALAPSAETLVVSDATFAYAPIHWADSLSAIWQPPKLS